MRFNFACLFPALLVFAVVPVSGGFELRAQTPAAAAGQTPAATPQTPTAGAQTKTAGQQGAVPVLRTGTKLVVVDVVVQDGKGNPLHGLKASDFSLSESGKPQTVSHFEEHSQMSAADAAKVPPMPKLAPGVFTNFTPAPTGGAINVLLLDALNTPMKDQAFVRQEMLKYLKSPRPGARMAIFGLAQQLHLLQGFTSDPEVLRAALNTSKATAKGSPLLDDPVSGNTYGQDTLSEQAADALGNAPGAAQIIASMKQFEAEQSSMQLQLRARITLDALNALGRYLSSIPGRKNLIWFSGSFPISIMPDGDLDNPFAVMASMEDEYHETVNLLARAQVSVYPVDARGLMGLPMFSAENSGAKYARGPQAMNKDTQKFFQDTAAEHGTMLQMAADTGGKAFLNTNGLKEAVEKAIDAGSNYYTLAYSPTAKDWRGEYRKIQVSLDRAGYQLTYRKGYFADDPDKPVTKHSHPVAAATAPTAPPYDPMHSAMQWGGPEPTEITMAAQVRPVSAELEPEAIKSVRADAKAKAPFRRYAVLFDASPFEIQAPVNEKGEHHIEVEFLTFSYDDQGQLMTTTGNRVIADLPDARYKAILKGGLEYRQDISVPARGSYFLRCGVRDLQSNRVGAVEFPVDSVKRLKPLSELHPETPAGTAAGSAADEPAKTSAPPAAPKQ